MRAWQMQEAKARLSDLVKRAQSQGPQEITMHGRSAVVVVSRETFDRLSHAGESLVTFMRNSPLHGLDEIEFERDKSMTRDAAF